MNKNIISIVLICIFIVSCCSFNANAEERTVTVTVIADKKEAMLGEAITYTVSLEAVPEPGIAGMEMNLVIPDGLDYVKDSGKVTDGLEKIMNASMVGFADKKNLKFTYNYNGTTYTSYSDTTLMTFQCVVKENAPESFEVSVEGGNGAFIYDEDLKDYEVEINQAVAVIAEGHEHSHSKEWSMDETNHWRECACDNKVDFSEHSYNSENKCTTCGITLEEAESLIIEEEEEILSFEKTDNTENAEEAEEGDKSSSENSDNTLFWIVMGVIGVLSVLVVILIIKKMPKRKK